MDEGNTAEIICQVKNALCEDVRIIPVELAVRIGDKPAMFIRQLHYWLEKSKHKYHGKKWVYNTYEGWKENFPWLSVRTIQRMVYELEQLGLIETGDFNKMKYDKTKWYTINYEVLGAYYGIDKLAKSL